MKRGLQPRGAASRTGLSLALALSFAACTQTTPSTSAGLIGTHDLVFVDQLAEDGTLAKVESGTDALIANGIPSRFLFVTSADTNELRVLEMYRPNTPGRDFMRGPNPLETLSIPVLDRPTMLATGEGQNSIGQRATSQYVFAARPGGAEVSAVSVTLRRQLGSRPLAVPAPVLAISASMKVTADQKPGITTLYVATWDGEDSSVFVTELDPDPTVADAAIRGATQKFRRLTTIDDPISALMVIAPVMTRTVDGLPFCNTEPCLALASRVNSAGTGEGWLLEPSTGRTVTLGFPGPVRKFAAGTFTRRLYALLDEAACGGPECGGVVAVDLLTGTTPRGFPESKDVIGRPFGPLRVTAGLLTGLSIAQGGAVAHVIDTVDDAGASDITGIAQVYDELGAFASSDGLITWFSGNSGSVLDYDMRRSIVRAANLRAPGLLADGGFSITSADGGFAGAFIEAAVDSPSVLSQTFRQSTITLVGDFASVWTVDVSDGHFLSQEFLVVNEGQLPGLVFLDATSVADGGVRLATAGFESRAMVGDTAVFFTGSFIDANVTECGRAKIAAINSGSLNVDAVPCANATLYSLRASGMKPWVVVGSVDGYMGRSAPGEQFTYNKSLILIPAEVIAARTAMTIGMANRGALVGEGSFLAFSLTAHMTPLRIAIDSTAPGLTKCSSQLPGQVVFGNLSMIQTPLSVNAQTTLAFPWKAFAVVPSGNSVVELTLGLLTPARALTNGEGAVCYR